MTKEELSTPDNILIEYSKIKSLQYQSYLMHFIYRNTFEILKINKGIKFWRIIEIISFFSVLVNLYILFINYIISFYSILISAIVIFSIIYYTQKYKLKKKNKLDRYVMFISVCLTKIKQLIKENQILKKYVYDREKSTLVFDDEYDSNKNLIISHIQYLYNCLIEELKLEELDKEKIEFILYLFASNKDILFSDLDLIFKYINNNEEDYSRENIQKLENLIKILRNKIGEVEN